MHRETITVELAGGARVAATLLHPAEPRALLLCLPALGVAAAYYEPLAAAFGARGIAVASADLRGLGASNLRPRRGVDFGYAELVDDTLRIAAALRRRVDAPLHLFGHSLGGHVAALAAGVHPAGIDGLILCACGTPYWRRFPARTGAQVWLLAHAARAFGATLGYFPGRRIGFGGTEAARLMAEWGGLARKGRLVAAGLDAERAFAAVAVPTLAVSLAGDWMAPRAAVDHLVAKLARASVVRRHLSAETADPRGLDHFRWVRHPQAVIAEVEDWLGAGAAPAEG